MSIQPSRGRELARAVHALGDEEFDAFEDELGSLESADDAADARDELVRRIARVERGDAPLIDASLVLERLRSK